MPSRDPGVSLAVVREAVRTRIAETSARQIAREVGMSHPALLSFVEDNTTPRGATVAKLRAWYADETNELVRLRREIAELRKRLAECEGRKGKG